MNKEQINNIKKIYSQVVIIENLINNDFFDIMDKKNQEGFKPINSLNNRLEEITYYLDKLKEDFEKKN